MTYIDKFKISAFLHDEEVAYNEFASKFPNKKKISAIR